MARQKEKIARLCQLQFSPTKVISVAYIYIYNFKVSKGKLYPANTSCVFCSLLVFTARHDMELGTKHLPLRLN